MILIKPRLHLHAPHLHTPHPWFISPSHREAADDGRGEGEEKGKKELGSDVRLPMVLKEIFTHLTAHYIISLPQYY